MFTADRPRLLDRRALLKSAAATTALATTGADHLLSILHNPQEQNENETTPLILGQAVTVDNRGRVTISDFASNRQREFRLPLNRVPLATVKISPDGQQAAIWCQTGDGRTLTGSQHLFIVNLGEHGPDLEEIYQKRNFVPLGVIRWSGDKSFLSLASGSYQRDEFVIFQLAERKIILRIGNTPSDPSFSPDSNWLTYANQEGRFLQNLRTGWSTRFGRTSPAVLSNEVWSPDSQTLAFWWDKAIYTYNTNVAAGRSAGEADLPQGFSPDGRLLVYLETDRTPKLAIFDLETGKKVNTPALRDAYRWGEISFLDTKTFRIVAQDDSTENEVRTATIDATTGEIVDSRVIKLPRYTHLFTSSSPFNPERFVNPNWVVLGNYQTGNHEILLASLETGQITRVPGADRGEAEIFDAQMFVVQNNQLLRSGNTLQAIFEGKRYGFANPETTLFLGQLLEASIPNRYLQALPESQEQLSFLAGDLVTADGNTWWYLRNSSRYATGSLGTFTRNIRSQPKRWTVPKGVLERIPVGSERGASEPLIDWDGKVLENQPNGGRMVVFIPGWDSDQETGLRPFARLKTTLIKAGWRETQFPTATYNVEVNSQSGQITPQPYTPEYTQRYPLLNVTSFRLLLQYYKELLPKTKFILIGHSLGGYMAFNAAIVHADAVEAVITLSSPLKGMDRMPVRERCDILFGPLDEIEKFFGIIPNPYIPIKNRVCIDPLSRFMDSLGEEASEFLLRHGQDQASRSSVEHHAKELKEQGVRVHTFHTTGDSLIGPPDAILDNVDTEFEGKRVQYLWDFGILPELPTSFDYQGLLEVLLRHWDLLNQPGPVGEIAKLVPAK